MRQYENVFDKVTKTKVNKKTKKFRQIFARIYDTETKKVTIEDVSHLSIPHIYLPSDDGKYKSYIDNSVRLDKLRFKSFDNYNDFVKRIKEKTGEMITVTTDDDEEFEFEETAFEEEAHGYQNAIHTYIHRYFPTPTDSDHTARTWFLDIETRSGQVIPNSFPHADSAYEEITMIQIHDSEANMYIVLGRKDFTGTFDLPNIKFIKYEQEVDLLEAFLRLLEALKPAIISGWNCLPLGSSVWKKDEIVNIENIVQGDILPGDVNVINTSPIFHKDMMEIELSNGSTLKSSPSHIYKTYSVKKNKYFHTDNMKNLVSLDLTARDIKNSIDSNIYLTHKMHKNKNKDLTYRQILIKNIDVLHNRGLYVFCRDNEIVIKMTKKLGRSTYQEKMNFFNSEYIISVLGLEEYELFINRNDNIKLITNGYNSDSKIPITARLDNIHQPIGADALWFAGMWYTDGTHSYKTDISISNTNTDIIQKCAEITNRKYSLHKDNCYYVGSKLYSDGKMLIMKSLIYSHMNVKSSKRIDINMFSQMSEKQFYIFYAGLIDGDGESASGSWLNYNGDTNTISQLIKWNNGFAIERPYYVTPFLQEEDLAIVRQHCKYKKRSENIKSVSKLRKPSVQKNVTYFITDSEEVLIRVNNVSDKSSNVPMMDIETSNHYFEFEGITTHNSMTFDIPYITNRIARVMDGYEGTKENLNKRSSYVDMPNVNRLSPVGEVRGRPRVETKDGMTGVSHRWQGIYLIDYKELAIKYGFLGLASYSLKNIAKHFDLSQKIDHSTYANFDDFYTGLGYIFPLEPIENDEIYDIQLAYKEGRATKEEMQQTVYNRFTEYSVRDVEILVELDKLKKYLAAHRGIAYLCGVTMDDNWNTLSHWSSLVYKEAYKQDIVLPLIQQNAKFDTTFLAGWVRTVPGKYQYITSFDFTSLYPSLIRTYNIGADTYINDNNLPEELLELRKKYFSYYNMDNLNRIPHEVNDYGKPVYRDYNGEVSSEEEGGTLTTKPLGKTVNKHNNEINDIQEETDYFLSILDNEDKITPVLKKYNVGVTPNGYFYSNEKQSILSKQMETIFIDRVKHKREAQRLYDLIQQGDTTQETRDTQEYNDNMSVILKIVLNSVYGSTALKYNTFSNGQVTASSITTAGRFSNKLAALACSQKVQQLLGEEKTNELVYIPQSDTDSVVGDSEIYINDTKIKIKDLFYNSKNSNKLLKNEIDNVVIDVENKNYKTKSLNTKSGIIEDKKVKYIMGHKVQKRMYKITHHNKTVTVTEDHSIIVKRNGKFQDVRPVELTPTDKIIVL